MKQHEVTVPQIGLIAGTRAMLGAGIALLLSEKLTGEQRRAIGWTLVACALLIGFTARPGRAGRFRCSDVTVNAPRTLL